MNLVKKLLIFFSGFSTACFAQNYYDLTNGITRYYDYDQGLAYGIIYLGTYRGIEEITGDTLIQDRKYAIIKWKAEKINDIDDEITFYHDTAYYRFDDGLLYKYTNNGDSVVQDFTFSTGDTISNFYSSEALASFFIKPPSVTIYDTIVHFTDGTLHKIIWGDDTIKLDNYSETTIPDKQSFMDSVLIDRGETWLLPFGATQTYFPYKPFYFIDSLGIVYSEWNYRKMAMVGVEKPDGTLYGQKVSFITGIDKRSTEIGTYELYQNYPNPFNQQTQISFYLKSPGNVKITIFDTIGRKVTTLFEGAKTAGSHALTFNAEGLSSGVYYYRFETRDFTKIRKMIYLR